MTASFFARSPVARSFVPSNCLFAILACRSVYKKQCASFDAKARHNRDGDAGTSPQIGVNFRLETIPKVTPNRRKIPFQ